MRKGENTKQKLFDTAAELFSRYDFDNVTVDTIVEAAGLSKGTFYIYFESKDALIAEFLSNYVNSIDSDYKSHLESLPPETTATEMILSLIEKTTDVLTDSIGHHRMSIVYKVHLSNTINMEAVTGYNRKLYQMFADVLEIGLAQGEFRTMLPIDTLSKHFVMALRGLSYEWCIRYPNFDLKEQALIHFHIILNGIRNLK